MLVSRGSLGSILIRLWSDVEMTDRCLIDDDPRVFAIWDTALQADNNVCWLESLMSVASYDRWEWNHVGLESLWSSDAIWQHRSGSKSTQVMACCLMFTVQGSYVIQTNMMTSSNGNIFRVTGLLHGEFTGHWWIPLTKASGAELWCFLWSAPEPTVEQIIETPVTWDAIALIMTSL